MLLWQLDVTASAFMADGRKVKIVTGIDDHPRYYVMARAVTRALIDARVLLEPGGVRDYHARAGSCAHKG
jgi:hypothetical protein